LSLSLVLDQSRCGALKLPAHDRIERRSPPSDQTGAHHSPSPLLTAPSILARDRLGALRRAILDV
jgi:hypothetical protein